MEGVFQRILSVDLNKGLTGEERLPPKWYRDSIGGLGVAVQYLLEDSKSKKPLLDDPIIVMTGPLTGYPLPGTSRASVISYRKEANQFKLGSIHGKFPAYVKMAGFDGFVITGKSERPVGLHLSAKSNKIVNASPLWGKDIFHIEEGGGENTQDRSVLAIGPAGENGHPYANVVVDRWTHGTGGMGQDFGGKRVKVVLVEPDSELPRNQDTRGLPEWAASYLEKHSRNFGSGQTRRSCFGCVRCCGIFDPQADLLYVEEEFDKLQGLLPQWSNERLFLFYRECLKLGLGPLEAAEPFGRIDPQEDVQKSLEDFVTHPHRSHPEEAVGTHSWEEAFLSLQGWYRDTVFNNVKGIQGLMEKENWAMMKSCLPVCERWDMDMEEMLSFLNEVTGSEYSRQDLLNRSGVLMDQIMDLYRSLNYVPLGPQGIRSCKRRFPPVLRDRLGEYLRGRKWENSGFPKKNEI